MPKTIPSGYELPERQYEKVARVLARADSVLRHERYGEEGAASDCLHEIY